MKCLFFIDVQNGFVSERTAHVLPRLAQLAEEFREGPVVATRFLNPRGGPYEQFMGWTRLRSAPETDVLPQIAQKADLVADKEVYSACTPQVMDFLRAHDVTEVLLAGIDTDCCVLKTASDLFERGIRPVVLTDYCASNGGAASHAAAITVMLRTIGRRQLFAGAYPGKKQELPPVNDSARLPLPEELAPLREALAENIHDIWAAGRLAEGWRWGPARDDEKRQHPCLIPYGELPEAEKEYDRRTAEGTIRFILEHGFEITPPSE